MSPWQEVDGLADGPLAGVRIVDLSRLLAGPYCTMILGDLGADVIKVEKPTNGDETRFTDSMVVGESGYYLGMNRNKRGITADVRTPEGAEIVRRLATDADVLIENFRPRYLDARSLGYDELKLDNPRLVYCSITGYGTRGPLVDRPGMDILTQASCGLMAITGEDGRAPVRIGPPVADFGAAFLASIAILAALRARDVTGTGQKIDLSLMSASFALVANFAAGALNSDQEVPRLGSAHPQIVPYQAFETSDGYVAIGIINKKFWVRFCELLGCPEWANDERFRRNRDRIANREILVPFIEERIRKSTTAHWLEVLEKADIPCAPVASLREALEHEQSTANGQVMTIEHPRLGPMRCLGLPYEFTDTPGSIRLAPPDHGEHTAAVLAAIGYSPEDIARLEGSAVV
ncbi:CaiB/BaiF CoA transferase family protein [Capillimicrobium parvum]|uniref:Acetyl-CoA:oxalate CoA-transferase n=1 Tax=Capillimicrobium parvum TaxID=2884022 RepID=A0A9E6XXM4_9ACTN|nr:CoA transferase [Capillimicrobium parvum]UGS35978.1 Acetyl-CoA:oxalate CoA-transferase [Capillimicrobium parvum]